MSAPVRAPDRPTFDQIAERLLMRLEMLKRAVLNGTIERRQLPRAPVGKGPHDSFRA